MSEHSTCQRLTLLPKQMEVRTLGALTGNRNPEQIDGSRKVTKKRLPWQIPSTSAALAATSGQVHASELAATSGVCVPPALTASVLNV